MPSRRMRVASRARAPLAPIAQHIDRLIDSSPVPIHFPAQVLAEAHEAERQWRTEADAHQDMTDIEFVTLDPLGATDLDQALHIERVNDGYRVRYAIADLPLFVTLNGAIDTHARERGLTVYLPDRRIPLHPTDISEGAGSLLAGSEAPAFVWDFILDGHGRVMDVGLTRAIVMNREQLDYERVHEELEAGRGHEQMKLLLEVGAKRHVLEVERGGASLGSPEQEIDADERHVHVRWRRHTPIEHANAHVSLMTGMEAARIMLEHGTGIVRTMPPADHDAIARFRSQAQALKEPWPQTMPYGEFLATLDGRKGRHLALLNQATKLFRGAGYEAFSGGNLPANPVQAALAAPYAHTTAPLRRLVDRFSLLTCWAHLNGHELDPAFVEALMLVPALMGRASSRNATLEREARNIVELAVLNTLVGQDIRGTVIDRREDKQGALRFHVQFANPPIARWIDVNQADAEFVAAQRISIGSRVKARVMHVDPEPPTAELRLTTEDERDTLTPR